MEGCLYIISLLVIAVLGMCGLAGLLLWFLDIINVPIWAFIIIGLLLGIRRRMR